MGKDKVAKPENMNRGGDVAKGPKSSIIESFTPSMENLQPYNRKSGKK